MSSAIYIYYRIDAAQAAEARRCVQDLLQRVEQASGVRGRLLRQLEDVHLWMEVYEPVALLADFLAVVEGCAAEVGFHRILPPGGTRRIECFQPCV